MNERLRIQYLEALGVDSYVPRFILGGAPSPVLCDWSVDAEVVSQAKAENENRQNAGFVKEEAGDGANPEITSSSPSAASTSKSENLAHGLIDDLAATQARGSAAHSAAGSAASPPKDQRSESHPAQAVARFALSLWQVADDLLVIDSRESKLALPTDRLLINMLRAVGYPLGNLPKVEVLNWPMVENSAESYGEDEGREMVQAYLDVQLSSKPVKALWLMGNSARHYVIAPEDATSVARTGIISEAVIGERSYKIVLTSSLADILRQPQLKPEVWEAIQVLHPSLLS